MRAVVVLVGDDCKLALALVPTAVGLCVGATVAVALTTDVCDAVRERVAVAVGAVVLSWLAVPDVLDGLAIAPPLSGVAVAETGAGVASGEGTFTNEMPWG